MWIPVLESRTLQGACLLLALAGSNAALGQQSPPDQDLTALSIEDLANTKVFAASLHLQDTSNAPSSVTVITQQEIRAYGWRTLADALRSIRGFYTSYDRTYTYLGVRGFSRPGDYNSRVLLQINGHRMNDNVYDEAMVGSEFPLDMDLVERIEIVRGPSSSLYGTNAFFGVINVITRSASMPVQIETSGDISSYYSRSGRVTVSGKRGRFSGLVSGTLDRSDGNPRLYFREFDSPATDNGVVGDVDGESGASAFSDFTYGDIRFQSVNASREKLIPTGAYGSNLNDRANRVVDTRNTLDLSYTHELSAGTEISLRSYYDIYICRNSFAFGGVDPSLRFLGYLQCRADWFGFSGNVSHEFGHHRLIFGSDYEKNLQVRQHGYYTALPTVFDDTHVPSMVATFAQAELRLAPQLSANIGGRYDHFTSFGHAVSPRAALIFAPDNRTSFKYVFGKAFRAPNAYEAYFHDDIVLAQTGPLQPESIRSHEVILERQSLSWLRLSASAYNNHMKRLIELQPSPIEGLSQYKNFGSDTGRGVEVEAEAKRESGLAARASYTLSEGRNGIDQKRLSSSPLHLAKINLLLPLSKRGVLGAEAQYTSPQESFQGSRVSSSLLMNVTVSSRPIWGGFDVSASCYNCLDRQWFSPGTLNVVQRQIPQDGRTYRFKIAKRFGFGNSSQAE